MHGPRPNDAMSIVLPIVRLPHSQGLTLPAYETAGAAGMDLRAAIPEDRNLIILPGRRALVPTGLVFEIPAGHEGQVRPRSGLALKHGITCLNTPGTIDSDYRGEVQVLLVNLGDEDFALTRGMRIAQLVIAPVVQATVEESVVAQETPRGASGFGSTGAR
ncbi:dUTP diphosphatase [Aquibium sp. LZ166]|uniref:Deoxyuridine 5'-triphosphate nucleotidohydrolase n=2 Tax=Aquibium pacificus TaxID=3153579 RepID=A0ABV3SF37_9HYPH